MKTKRHKKLSSMVVTFLFILFALGHTATGSVPREKNKGEILNKVYSLQIPFVENEGQIGADSVRYYAKTLGGTAFVTRDGELVYSLPVFINPP